MTDSDEYLQSVRETLADASRFRPSTRLAEVENLVEHGEPAEGMCSLAWAIVWERVRVPRQLINEIREHSKGLVESESMPPNLDDFAEGSDT